VAVENHGFKPERLEKCMLTRRDALTLVGSLALARNTLASTPVRKSLRVRTITTGVPLDDASQADRFEKAASMLKRARRVFEQAGFEVQTLRIATNPFIARMTGSERTSALARLEALDRVAAEHGVIVSVGPVLAEDRDDFALADWAREFVTRTRSMSFSAVIASKGGPHTRATAAVARVIAALTTALPDGLANFRFAAAANVPAGTPFFPVGWHEGAPSIAIGMESASLVEEAFRDAGERPRLNSLRDRLNEALKPVEKIASAIAQDEELAWLGIDTSPAPMKDRSIGAAIEAYTGLPFGSGGTLEACSTITAAIKSVDVKTCGYCGLMLPVLEDPILAQRAGEARYSLRDLLLYSSVCGTGIDVAPIAGDTPAEAITGLLRDVAALSSKLDKALSARLFPVPGRKVGEIARFNDPYLVDSVVMKLD
jgi:uncharacterized protein (UPF0210 family)